MNGTIDVKEAPEFSAGFLRWLFSLTIVVLLLVFFIEPRVSQRMRGQNDYLMPASAVAGGVRVEQGIQEFQGSEIEPVDAGKRMQALIYLLVTFVAVPVCFLFFVTTFEPDPATATTTLLASLRTLFMLMCITVASIIFISTVVSSVKSPAVFKTMKSDNAASEERDMLVKDLIFAYNDVVRYHYQTKHYGGKKKNLTEVKSLAELGIQKAKFETSIRQNSVEKNSNTFAVKIGSLLLEAFSNGVDHVEFFLSTNVGEDVKPLAKVASGGEVSRIMLALKSALAQSDKTPLLIFDEIDTGVSGRIGQSVGLSLKKLSKHHQVIAITHLPQIAGLADTHFAVEKTEANKKTSTRLRLLNNEERIKEVAKLLSGENITEAGLKSAKELMGIK